MKLFNSDDIRYTVAHDLGDGELVLETKQNVDQYIERNKVLQEVELHRTKPVGDVHLVASIPFTVIDELNKQGIMKGYAVVDEKRFKAWLNHPDQQAWKIYRGKL
jgi:aspartate ammonia-lyase